MIFDDADKDGLVPGAEPLFARLPEFAADAPEFAATASGTAAVPVRGALALLRRRRPRRKHKDGARFHRKNTPPTHLVWKLACHNSHSKQDSITFLPPVFHNPLGIVPTLNLSNATVPNALSVKTSRRSSPPMNSSLPNLQGICNYPAVRKKNRSPMNTTLKSAEIPLFHPVAHKAEKWVRKPQTK